MNVMFASGDVGGARALLPVMKLCEKHSLPFIMLEHGHIVSESPNRWRRILPDRVIGQMAVKNLFKKNKIGAVVFASSVKDTTALNLARHAKGIDAPVIHVLDSWSGYRKRMETDGLPAFVPDIYTAPDNFALEEAVKDGIEERILRITGQPALASLYEEYIFHKGLDALEKRKKLGFDPSKTLILFISEPVEHDQGSSAESPQYRGYTEKIVLRLFCQRLQAFSDRIEIGLLPHPREDRKELLGIWNHCRGALQGKILSCGKGRESLFLGGGFAGMASILLYEAWLLGKPVISLQPGLRLRPLRMLEARDGVVFIDSYQAMDSLLNEWVSKIRTVNDEIPRPELQMYKKAPDNVFMLIKKCLNQ